MLSSERLGYSFKHSDDDVENCENVALEEHVLRSDTVSSDLGVDGGDKEDFADQLDDCARDMLDSLRASDRAINSAATRIRYDPGFQGSPSLVKVARGSGAKQKRSHLIGDEVEDSVLHGDFDDASSTDSFLQALKIDDNEDNGALLRKWRARNKQEVALFNKDVSSESDSDTGLALAARMKVANGKTHWKSRVEKPNARKKINNTTRRSRSRSSSKSSRSTAMSRSSSRGRSIGSRGSVRGERRLTLIERQKIAAEAGKRLQYNRLAAKDKSRSRSRSFGQSSNSGKFKAAAAISPLRKPGIIKSRPRKPKVHKVRPKKKSTCAVNRRVAELLQKETELMRSNRALEQELRGTRLKLKQAQKTERVALARANTLQEAVKQLKTDLQRKNKDPIRNNATRPGADASAGLVERLQHELMAAKRRIAQLIAERRKASTAGRRDFKRDEPTVATTKAPLVTLSGSNREYLTKPRAASPLPSRPSLQRQQKQNLNTSYLNHVSSSSEEDSDSTGERFTWKSAAAGLNTSTSSRTSSKASTASERYQRLKAHYTRKYHPS